MQPRKHLLATCSVLLIAALLAACAAPAAAPAPPPIPPCLPPTHLRRPQQSPIPLQSCKPGRMRSTAATWRQRWTCLPTTAVT